MKTYSETTNALGVTPQFFEKIMNLHYLIGELHRQLESINRLRRNVVDYAGKPKGEISAAAVSEEVRKALSLYSNIRVKASSLPVNIAFEVCETGSNCCFAPLIENTDICSACKEHCTLVAADDTDTEDDIACAGCELMHGRGWVISVKE